MDTTKIAQALSDPIRYRILMMLASSQSACCRLISNDQVEAAAGMCNCEIMYELGMIQSRVSYHMKELVETGLVNEEQRGKWKYYFFNRRKMTEYIAQLKQDFVLE